MPVRDIVRATEFYRDTLGLTFLFSAPPQLAFFDCDGVRLMLTVSEAGEFDHLGSVLYFKVSDITGAHADLADRGVRFREGPRCIARLPDREVWLAAFDDPEGNTLALMSEV